MIEKIDPKDYASDPNINRDVRLMKLLNALIDAYNDHVHNVNHDCMGTTSETSLPSEPAEEETDK